MSRRKQSRTGDTRPGQRLETIDNPPKLALELAESAGVVTTLSPGRLSRDWPQQYPMLPVLLPPPDPEGAWEFYHADERTLRRFSVTQIMDWMVDLSPEVSRAHWDLLRLCNPGWTCQCFHVGRQEPYKAAQVALDAFFLHLNNMYGAADIVFNELFTQCFLRGAMFTELVLDRDAFYPIDLATPDPSTARFKREYDPVRGPVWVLGQFQLEGFTPMVRPTIRYVPIDKRPGSPYGRPMAAPALFPTLFLMTLLHDLRRVVGQQGYPRIDLKIDLNALMNLMPQEVKFSPTKSKEWITATIDEIKREYAHLEPDDAFVHNSALEVGRPVGTVDASSLGGIGAIIAALERMATRAVKEMPIMMGLSDQSSEGAANRQWEIQASGIRALQHVAETTLESFFGLGLRAQGMQAAVKFRFNELRAAQALRDAQTQQLVMSNQAYAYDRGWISQDQAALVAAGQMSDQPEPRVFPVTDQPLAGEGVPPGGPPEPAEQGGAPAGAPKEPVSPDPSAERDRELAGVA